MKHFKLWVLMGLLACVPSVFAQTGNVKAIKDLLNRIGGEGTAERFRVVIDPAIAENGKETFILSTQDDKPCVTGSTSLAVTTGINWYLNHYANTNLTWNRLQADLSKVDFPLPAEEDKHVCTADYRYYLNYCTFSYSMAFWTWERWQQEIDWMALHGINMPLQIVGTDVVWRNVMKELGYNDEQIARYVAGPGYQAWWLMDNLEGWGGPNPDWWYDRQEQLAKQINGRMRELGIEPVLPGFSGQVPSAEYIGQGTKPLGAAPTGRWCYFTRPDFMQPTNPRFNEISLRYYHHLKKVMGTSKYYSMDLFHEGGVAPAGVDPKEAYEKVAWAMLRENPKAKWVIQQWQWSHNQYQALKAVPKGKLVVLDLFSDGNPRWQQNGYEGHDFVYCMLHNFGGRVGLHGRLEKTAKGYYDAIAQYPANAKGIGTTPEGIETNPVLYDLLYELPWAKVEDAYAWLDDYATNRYGKENAVAQEAWQLIGKSALNCNNGQQGTSEPIICARPALEVWSASTWSRSALYYNPQDIIQATALMLSQEGKLKGVNYDYDVVDIARQSFSNYAQPLLAAVKAAYTAQDTTEFNRLSDCFLQLILDQDRLLSTTPEFYLGRWTQMARDVTDEVGNTSILAKEWMEWNARKQITTWGNIEQANYGGLRDYSNREWGGLLKDYYYPRWAKYFASLKAHQSTPTAEEWYDMEDTFCNEFGTQYKSQGSKEKAIDVAKELFPKYFMTFETAKGTYYVLQHIANELDQKLNDVAFRDQKYSPVLELPKKVKVESLQIDWNGNEIFEQNETSNKSSFQIPADAVNGLVKAQMTLTNHTVIHYFLLIKDKISRPRTVTVVAPSATEGTLQLNGKSVSSVETQEEVHIAALPASAYNFMAWQDEAGKTLSTRNPYVYTGKEPLTVKAVFEKDIWGMNLREDRREYNDIKNYEQYVQQFQVQYSSGEAKPFYTAGKCPEQLYNVVPNTISAARGSQVTLHWNDTGKGGLSYCRLSAYIDLNGDGDFNDEGEFLQTLGGYDKTDGAVSKNKIQVLLPYDSHVGMTHLRLRFDGAWQHIGEDRTTHAIAADQKTLRMVYDIKLNITERATTTTVITAVAHDDKGTIMVKGGEIDNQNPATVTAGKKVTLTATPKTGYRFACWKDQYGREVSHDASYSFYPAETGTLTAYFRR